MKEGLKGKSVNKATMLLYVVIPQVIFRLGALIRKIY